MVRVVAIVASVVGVFFGFRSNVLYVESIGHVDCGSVLTDSTVCGTSAYSSSRRWMIAMWSLAAILLIVATLTTVLRNRRQSASREKSPQASH